MRVRIIDVDQNSGEHKERGECDLRDCFFNEEEAYEAARDEIRASGRVWIGGGAAPLVLLMRVQAN